MTSPRTEVHFSPGDACRECLCDLLRNAKRSVDICVFTITDNRISREIFAAHARGVLVRIISDNDKADDRGSDIHRFIDAKIPVALDRSDKHMHHKFAVFDGAILVTGSYNWTRSAAEYNEENLVVLEIPSLILEFGTEFEFLWQTFKR